jgi:hypothetical protein
VVMHGSYHQVSQHISLIHQCMYQGKVQYIDGGELSSARGELQGQTALAIMSSTVLNTHNETGHPVNFIGDNKGIQQKTATYIPGHLKAHHDTNCDIFLEYHNVASNVNCQVTWVKSHQDDGTPWNTIDKLLELKLSSCATMNMCDKQANDARIILHSDMAAETYPMEWWALHANAPYHHKITGKLNTKILLQLYHDELLHYIENKHGLTSSKLQKINQEALDTCLNRLKPTQQASSIKWTNTIKKFRLHTYSVSTLHG